MEFTTFENAEELAEEVVSEITALIEAKPDALLCIAAGETPRPVMNRLIEYKKQGKVDFSRVRFIGLDEWIGVGRETVGSCAQMLYDDFFIPMDLREDQIMIFDGLEEVEKQIMKMDRLSEELRIDFMLLGVGMNGHLGLNEPGEAIYEQTHVVELSEITKQVMTKYFDGKIKISQGITLGFKQFFDTKRVILMATGKRKASIVNKIISSEATSEVPASLMKESKENVSFFVDKDARKI